MSLDWHQDIVDFHEQVMEDAFSKQPHLVGPNWSILRRNLIKEEVKETLHAIAIGDLTGIADGVADCVVVLLGTAITYGIDMRPVWDIVHESNMAKKGGKLREDGKLLKPPGWEPPNVRGEIIRQQGMDKLREKVTVAEKPSDVKVMITEEIKTTLTEDEVTVERRRQISDALSSKDKNSESENLREGR